MTAVVAGSFGAQLKALRESAGYTQEELATIAGLSVHAISALERGERRRPHVETIRALSVALDLSAVARDALLKSARPPTPRPASPEFTAPTIPVAPTRLIGRDADVHLLQGWLNDPASRRAQAQANVLNTSLGDRERLSALYALRRTGPGSMFADPSYDESVVAAVIQIGMTSRDADARANAWTSLHFVEDSAVLQPLLYALANDSNERVRAAAARALSTHVDEPGVGDALRRAAAEDPNDQPTVACCIPTVRESARLALRGGMTPHDAVRSAVLDESLSPHERLLLTSPQNLGMRLDQFDADVARAVFALGVAADDPGLRARAWGLLEAVREPEFKAPLLEDLARHPAENVRTAAARGLIQLRDEPDVRAALEQALNDSSAGVRRTARASLDGVGLGFGR